MAKRGHVAVPAEDVDVQRCLSFVNTRSGRETDNPTETLVSFEALLDWARAAGLLRGEEAERLVSRAKRRHTDAERVLSQARTLRELLHDVFTQTRQGHSPAPATLEALSAHLSGWYHHGRLAPSGDTLQWVYAGGDKLDRVLWEVARTATRLLTSPTLARVRPCASHDCGWWFADETKNGSRRWCDMKICGNREKLRRFRQRDR
jgi:predicted RNA-binding Zn ribbon-like protein